jgi:Mg-chelatase subunit ChlD
MLLADISASMASPDKAALRNTCLLQLSYSFWRAGDRVATTFFDEALYAPIRETNLRMQMQRVAAALHATKGAAATDVSFALREYLRQGRQRYSDLLFLVSDFVSSNEHELDPEIEWRPVLNEMQRNIVPVIVSFEIPERSGGVMKLWDPERRCRRLVRLSKDRIRSINEKERARISTLAGRFRSAGLDTMILSNQRQIYPQLAKLARTRRLRKH